MPASAAPSERPPTLLESALRHDRALALIILSLISAAAWLWIIVMARDMYGPMTGAAAWMMTATWDVPHTLLLWAMWAVMMTGMMLPSASPLLLMYGVAARRSSPGRGSRRIYALAAGYLAVWGMFSVGATALQRVLADALLVSPMMEVTSARLSGALLIVAGIYQWTPLKQACLRTCQSPLGFLMSRWRDGWRGAFRMGAEHGSYCVGCCWALMLLLFAGGVMNLIVIAALTAFVVLEKSAVLGSYASRLSGALLMAAGSWALTR